MVKRVLITGALGTIGQALTAHLSDYELLLHDYKNRLAIPGDLSTPEGVRACLKAIDEPLYAIIHTVGPYEGPFPELFYSNVVSIAELAAALKPTCLITFGVAGLSRPGPKRAPYWACKNALLSLTKSLAASGMRANMICPHVVVGSRHIVPGPQVEALAVAKLVAFLLSSEAISGQVIDIANNALAE